MGKEKGSITCLRSHGKAGNQTKVSRISEPVLLNAILKLFWVPVSLDGLDRALNSPLGHVRTAVLLPINYKAEMQRGLLFLLKGRSARAVTLSRVSRQGQPAKAVLSKLTCSPPHLLT